MTEQTEGRLRVPATAEDMLPPSATSARAEMESLVRSHYDELKPGFEVLSCERESKHKKLGFDQAELAFKTIALANSNGYVALSTLSTDKIWRLLRLAFKDATGIKMKLLEDQYKQLRVTHRRRQP